jgi:hypothetical protein
MCWEFVPFKSVLRLANARIITRTLAHVKMDTQGIPK